MPLADEEFATLQENIGAVGMVMLGAMLLTLWFATRSVRLVVAIFGTIVLGLIVTLAVGLFAVGRLNLISVAFIPLFVGLGVDFGGRDRIGIAGRAVRPVQRRAACAVSSTICATAAAAPL